MAGTELSIAVHGAKLLAKNFGLEFDSVEADKVTELLVRRSMPNGWGTAAGLRLVSGRRAATDSCLQLHG